MLTPDRDPRTAEGKEYWRKYEETAMEAISVAKIRPAKYVQPNWNNFGGGGISEDCIDVR